MLQIEENANGMAICQNFCIYFNRVKKKKPQNSSFEKKFYPIMSFATFLLVLR